MQGKRNIRGFIVGLLIGLSVSAGVLWYRERRCGQLRDLHVIYNLSNREWNDITNEVKKVTKFPIRILTTNSDSPDRIEVHCSEDSVDEFGEWWNQSSKLVLVRVYRRDGRWSLTGL